jgi:short-subunit dehydrogenase
MKENQQPPHPDPLPTREREKSRQRHRALVTGASAGIGAEFARQLAARGCDLVITARRGERLQALASELRARHGVAVQVIADDLADPGAPARIIAATTSTGPIDILVNNAGYGVPGRYDKVDWQTHARFMQVLVTAPLELCHLLLPAMRERGYGRIVNVASLAGLIPGSMGHTLYGATKSFLVKFSQSLHLENLSTGVHVSALCPGFTFSEFHDVNDTRDQLSQSTPEWLWMGADEVAAMGYEAAEANRPVCVTGAPNKAIAAFAKIVPDDWTLALMASQSGRFRKA